MLHGAAELLVGRVAPVVLEKLLYAKSLLFARIPVIFPYVHKAVLDRNDSVDDRRYRQPLMLGATVLELALVSMVDPPQDRA